VTPGALPIADARIRASRIDPSGARVVIDIDFLQDPDDTKRRRASLVFEGARSLERVADSLKLAAAPGASTVLHWQPCAPGNTFLYLMDGVISIWAQALRIEVEP
jgi:hypothetical protein